MDSRVLLCCIEPRGSPDLLTESEIGRFFSGFGELIIVRVFTRKTRVKAFLEYATHLDAANAIACCSGKDTPLGAVRLEFSQKDRVTAARPGRPLVPPFSEPSFIPHQLPPKPLQTTKFTASNVASPADTNPELLGPTGPRVLIIHQATNPKFTARALANVFGIFGNVSKVLINTVARYAMVQMESGAAAEAALLGLDGKRLFGTVLKVRVSHHQSLDVKSLDRANAQEFELLLESPAHQRFPPQTARPGPVSSALLTLQPCPPELTLPHLQTLLSTTTAPLHIQPFSSPKNGPGYLLKFGDLSECFDAIADLQNLTFNQTPLRLWFPRGPDPARLFSS